MALFVKHREIIYSWPNERHFKARQFQDLIAKLKNNSNGRTVKRGYTNEINQKLFQNQNHFFAGFITRNL